jgi:hypothetical protein
MTPDLFIKMVLDAWNTKIAFIDKLLAELSDEQLQKEIAPGKNTGVYILGHLAGISNRMIPLLNLGNELKPELYNTYVELAEKDITQHHDIKQLRQEWTRINAELSKLFARVTPDDWFKKHNAVSDADFATQPHRNKLNVIINRTNHLDYHAGQLVLLK